MSADIRNIRPVAASVEEVLTSCLEEDNSEVDSIIVLRFNEDDFNISMDANIGRGADIIAALEVMKHAVLDL